MSTLKDLITLRWLWHTWSWPVSHVSCRAMLRPVIVCWGESYHHTQERRKKIPPTLLYPSLRLKLKHVKTYHPLFKPITFDSVNISFCPACCHFVCLVKCYPWTPSVLLSTTFFLFSIEGLSEFYTILMELNHFTSYLGTSFTIEFTFRFLQIFLRLLEQWRNCE